MKSRPGYFRVKTLMQPKSTLQCHKIELSSTNPTVQNILSAKRFSPDYALFFNVLPVIIKSIEQGGTETRFHCYLTTKTGVSEVKCVRRQILQTFTVPKDPTEFN